MRGWASGRFPFDLRVEVAVSPPTTVSHAENRCAGIFVRVTKGHSFCFSWVNTYE